MLSKDFNFEKSLEELETIANNLDDENISVDKSVELFEKGVKLSRDCSQYLENVKQKIILLSEAEKEDDNG